MESNIKLKENLINILNRNEKKEFIKLCNTEIFNGNANKILKLSIEICNNFLLEKKYEKIKLICDTLFVAFPRNQKFLNGQIQTDFLLESNFLKKDSFTRKKLRLIGIL